LTLVGWYTAALGIGIAIGAVLFLLGMAAGGALGNARQVGKAPADINARIGVCLAAAGIASGALGREPPFPFSFRVFYAIILGIGLIGALTLAGWGMKTPPRS